MKFIYSLVPCSVKGSATSVSLSGGREDGVAQAVGSFGEMRFGCVHNWCRQCTAGRLLLRETPPRPGRAGGWVRGQKKVCVPKIGLKFPTPLMQATVRPKRSSVRVWWVPFTVTQKDPERAFPGARSRVTTLTYTRSDTTDTYLVHPPPAPPPPPAAFRPVLGE